MIKTILKEAVIIILICLAILLVLGILFYDYIPNNKIIPKAIAYTTPEDVQAEIGEEVSEETMVNITYELTQEDLDVYKTTQSYKPGKQNPFSDYATTNTDSANETGNTTSDKGTSGKSSSSTNETGTTTTPEQSSDVEENTNSYLPDHGTK